MERQAVNGERRRINWGDLLDEAWGKDEPLVQHATPTVPPDIWPTCHDCDSSLDDQDKENSTENDTKGAHKHTGIVTSVGREGKIAAGSSFLPLGPKFFSELSKSSKLPSIEINRKWVARDTGRRVRNTSGPTSKTKLQLKRSSGATTTTANKKRREKLRQLCLDLGQKSFGHATCRACGMVYSLGHTQDEADHARFHRRYLSGISFHGWKNERVVEVFFDGRILAVFPADRRHHLRKVRELCSLVDSELGLAAGVSPWRPTTKMYLYVSAAKKVMGCVFAERISEGYPVLGSPSTAHDSRNSSSTTSSSMTSLSITSSSLSEGQHLDSQSAWYCSSTPRPAIVGVNRVWVCRRHRRRGVASRILDTIRFNFISGSIVSKDQLAFSDPTPSGKAFAASYCGTENFLVYHWNS